MLKNTLFVVPLMISSLFTTCTEGYVGDMQKKDDTKEIRFSLNMEGGLTMFPTRSSVSLSGIKWKIFCSDGQYNYLFDGTESMGDAANEIKVPVAKGTAYRFLFLYTTADKFPELASGEAYWNLGAYVPQLPLADPMAMLVSRGSEKDGTLRVATTSASVQVTFAPRTSRIVLQKDSQTASDITVNSVTFADTASSVPYAHVEPQYCSECENLSIVIRKTYQYVPQKGICYMFPDMCAGTSGVNVTLHITRPASGKQGVWIAVPVGLALNVGSGKTYRVKMSANANGRVITTWATRVIPKTLKLVTQNLWERNASVVLDYFNKTDVDVLCAQGCSRLPKSDVQAQGLYVRIHSNNGQRKRSIMSYYPFSGITPSKYGVYIDLGEGTTVLVMNCHGAFYPYGSYQLNGTEYKGYEATDDVDYVVRVNKEARQGMVDKLLKDFNSFATPFVCLSGDFNEPSWPDWTEGTLSAGLASYVVQWPTTRSLWEGGMKNDACRTVHPSPVTRPGFTWTPHPNEKDTEGRLDLTLYTLSPNTDVKSCQVIGENTETSDIVLPNWGPFKGVFDHRGLWTEFVFTE